MFSGDRRRQTPTGMRNVGVCSRACARSGIVLTAHVVKRSCNCIGNRDLRFTAAGCVRCESRAAEGRREDPIGGTERRGEGSRRWNRRAAAAAIERREVGARASQAAIANANAGEAKPETSVDEPRSRSSAPRRRRCKRR